MSCCSAALFRWRGVGALSGVLLGVFILLACEGGQTPKDWAAAQKADQDKADREGVEARLLSARCAMLKRQLRRLPVPLRRDMAVLLSEADASFTSIRARVKNPGMRSFNHDAGKEMLDDARLFLDSVEKCINATKRKQGCQLEGEVQELLQGALEKEKDFSLRDLSNICSDAGQ
jgi:hypothetical protein